MRIIGEAGYYVPAIRFPTVPRETARLRVTLSARHTPEQIKGLCSTLGKYLVGLKAAETVEP
jgi:8-amino-7-oxononanoate synthase